MTTIEILKTYDDGVTFIEALKLAEGRHLLSNLDADMILQDEERYKKYSKLFYCWTGDLLVYEEPGKEFGEWVKDADNSWIIDIPKEFQGRKDIALLIQHPNFKIEKGKYDMTFVKPNGKKSYDYIAIPFKPKNGWYLPDSYGIPNGEELTKANKEARYLYRRFSATVRPVARWVNVFYDRRVVICGYYVDGRLGVGVVQPQAKNKK